MNLETRISRLEKIEERYTASPMHPFERVNRLFAIHEKWGGRIPDEYSDMSDGVRNFLEKIFSLMDDPKIPSQELHRALAEYRKGW